MVKPKEKEKRKKEEKKERIILIILLKEVRKGASLWSVRTEHGEVSQKYYYNRGI